MRLADKSGIAGVLYVLALAVLLSGVVSATAIESTGSGQANTQVVQPTDEGQEAFGFRILYGGDDNITGSPDPGTDVSSFEKNSTMFLNQSDADKGLNGYTDGEDIFNVSREHVGDKASVLNGTEIRNFSAGVYFLDGGVENNSVFDGNNSTQGFSGEAVVRSSSGKLGVSTEVVASGNVSARGLHKDVKFIDSGDGVFDGGVYGDEVLINSSDSTLDEEDEVISLGGTFSLDDFKSGVTRYLQQNSSQESFVASSAIVRENGDKDNTLQRDGDVIVKDGKADLLWANETTLLNADPGNDGFTTGDPIYYSQDNNNYINESDIRLGNYNVSSRPDSTGVSLGLELLSVMNDSSGAPESNDIGKTLGTYDAGNFILLEYGSPTNSWSPENTADQDVLVYDTEADGLSEGDVLVYNQDPDNGTVEASVGEEFTQSTLGSTDSSYTQTSLTTGLGFNDTDENQEYTAGDQVVLNISDSTNGVVLAPNSEAGDLISDEFNDTKGDISRWDVADSDNVTEDGLYIAMNETTTVSTGDVRLGHWNSTVELETDGSVNGTVESGDLDRGAQIRSFSSDDDIAALDRDNYDVYDAGIGRLSDNDKGREALISTEDEFLNASDEIIREGRMPSTDSWGDAGYFDNDGSGLYDAGEAIAKASNGFDNDSEVVISGSANISSIQDEMAYIETGENGFDAGKDPLLHDAGQDGVLGLGSLDRGDVDESEDYVFTERSGTLQNFNRSLNETGDSKTVFLDSDESEPYSAGEDIIEIDLVTNGSASDKFDGVQIFNFADSTKHTSEAYSDGEEIINDTDDNSVYQNVVQNLEVDNIVSSRDIDFFTEAGASAINGGLKMYRVSEETDEQAGLLEFNQGLQWTDGDLSENITEDTEFRLEFDAASSSDLEDKAYGFRGETSTIGLAGGSIGSITSEDTQVIDAHAPELVKSWTGDKDGGNSSATDKVFVRTNEKFSNMDYDSVNPGSFKVLEDDLFVDATKSTGNNDILLTLNQTVATNRNFSLKLDEGEIIRDVAGNIRNTDSVDSEDGLKPMLESQAYRDSDEDGQVDEVVLNFSEKISYNAFNADHWNVVEEQLSGLSVNSGKVTENDTLILEASADENITGVSSNEPFLDYESDAIGDDSGNDLSAYNQTLSDRAAPVIMNATTGDEDSDSFIDAVELRFTEPLDDEASELVPDSFNVSDAEVTDVESVSGPENISLGVDSELSTSRSPSVTVFNNSIFDPSLNAIDEDQNFTRVIDNARPVLLNAQINAEKSSYSNTFVDLRFSEAVKPLRDGDKTEEVNLSSKGLDFKNSGSGNLRTVEYGEILPTGDHPNISGIENITDANGNPAMLESSENVTVNSFRKEVVKGWNFVSFPIADDSTYEISEILDTSKIDVVWTYTDGGWNIYDPEASQNDFSTFEGGVGYMIKAEQEFTLNPNVNTARPDESMGEELIDASTGLDNGYNLIGTFQEHTVSADDSDTGAFGAIDTTHVNTAWKQSSDGSRSLTQIRYSTGDSPGSMMPGEAYWMNWEGDGATYSEPVVGGG